MPKTPTQALQAKFGQVVAGVGRGSDGSHFVAQAPVSQDVALAAPGLRTHLKDIYGLETAWMDLRSEFKRASLAPGQNILVYCDHLEQAKNFSLAWPHGHLAAHAAKHPETILDF